MHVYHIVLFPRFCINKKLHSFTFQIMHANMQVLIFNIFTEMAMQAQHYTVLDHKSCRCIYYKVLKLSSTYSYTKKVQYHRLCMHIYKFHCFYLSVIFYFVLHIILYARILHARILHIPIFQVLSVHILNISIIQALHASFYIVNTQMNILNNSKSLIMHTCSYTLF